jgi:hypothetical protein
MAYFRKKKLTWFEAWTPQTDMSWVSVSEADIQKGSPKTGDMIAIAEDNPSDRWLVEAATFAATYEPAE